MDENDALAFLAFCSVAGTATGFAFVMIPTDPVLSVLWLAIAAFSVFAASRVYRATA